MEYSNFTASCAASLGGKASQGLAPTFQEKNMTFHEIAIQYAQLASASVDSRGYLVHHVGSFSSGMHRDEALQALEELNRSTVVTNLIVEHGSPLTAHVVLSQEDGASGVETAVVGVCFDEISATEMADEAATRLCDEINAQLARDMGEDFVPLDVHLQGGERQVASNGCGIQGTVCVKQTSVLRSEHSSGSFHIGSLLGTERGSAIL